MLNYPYHNLRILETSASKFTFQNTNLFLDIPRHLLDSKARSLLSSSQSNVTVPIITIPYKTELRMNDIKIARIAL